MRTFDVVIYDDVSAPFSPRIGQERGLGGVEWTLMQLATALMRDGFTVLVLSKFEGSWSTFGRGIGHLEYAHVSRAYESSLACSALVVSRWSQVPPVEFKRLAFSLHDVPEHWMFGLDQLGRLNDGAVAVCVSRWQADVLGELFVHPGWWRPVIAPMLLDECYTRGPKDPNKFVYASAAVKGLRATIDTWALIHEHFQETHWGTLYVATNGYDDPSPKDAKRMDELAICSLGQLPAPRIIEELRSAAGLFFVNDFPETHCLIASTALALGCRCHVLTMGDAAALPETLAGAPLLTSSRHDFIEQFVTSYLSPGDPRWVLPASEVPDRRARALLPKWKEVLFDE